MIFFIKDPKSEKKIVGGGEWGEVGGGGLM